MSPTHIGMTGILDIPTTGLVYEPPVFFPEVFNDEFKHKQLVDEFFLRLEGARQKVCTFRNAQGKLSPHNTQEYIALSTHQRDILRDLEQKAYQDHLPVSKLHQMIQEESVRR